MLPIIHLEQLPSRKELQKARESELYNWNELKDARDQVCIINFFLNVDRPLVIIISLQSDGYEKS